MNKTDLNTLYKNEYDKAVVWQNFLSKNYNTKLSLGYKNYEKENGKWTCYYFPIFVITVENFLDLNINFFNEGCYFEFFVPKEIFHTLKLEKLINTFSSNNLQIYGGEDCLQEFIINKSIEKQINASTQTSIGFCFKTELNEKKLLNDIKEILDCCGK